MPLPDESSCQTPARHILIFVFKSFSEPQGLENIKEEGAGRMQEPEDGEDCYQTVSSGQDMDKKVLQLLLHEQGWDSQHSSRNEEEHIRIIGS